MKIFKILIAFPLLTVLGCGQKSPDIEATAQTVTSSYARLQADVNALSEVGISAEKIGRFEAVTFDMPTFTRKQSELMNSIRSDATLTGTDTSGQKGQLLGACNQALATALGKASKSKTDLKNFVLAYGLNGLQSEDVQKSITKLWGAAALNELLKADNLTMSSVVSRVLI